MSVSERYNAKRCLRLPQLPSRRRRNDCGQSLLNPYKVDLLNQWNAGEHRPQVLPEYLQQKGYCGSYQTLTRYLQHVRQAQGLYPDVSTAALATHP